VSIFTSFPWSRTISSVIAVDFIGTSTWAHDNRF
jgi:hypothetical protein